MRTSITGWIVATLLILGPAPLLAQRVADLPQFSPFPSNTSGADTFRDPAEPASSAPVGQVAVLLLSAPASGNGRGGTAGSVLIGAGAGVVLGLAAMYLTNGENCTEVGSMCGLAIPLWVGGGAVAGGLIGYVISRVSN